VANEIRSKGSTRIALAILAAVFACGDCLAQREVSLVTTRLEITGEVRRDLSLSVDDLRSVAQRRGRTASGGYSGIRLTELLEEADIGSALARPRTRYIRPGITP
jgi:DMSO/TMAO reductase YedYZ molybdopterin-dependent catalytic subunit